MLVEQADERVELLHLGYDTCRRLLPHTKPRHTFVKKTGREHVRGIMVSHQGNIQEWNLERSF